MTGLRIGLWALGSGRRVIAALTIVASCGVAEAADVPTLRVDYFHTGNALQHGYALERVVIEPLPWPGNPSRPIDTSNRGTNLFEVIDPKTNDVLYSRGFSTIFGEWRTTEEAHALTRGFEESLRFPKPERPVRVRVLERDARNAFFVVWSVDIDPDANDVARASLPLGPRFRGDDVSAIDIRVNGPSSQKVDLLVLGDGYAEADRAKFAADARRLTDHPFTVAPFSTRANDFNVRALMVPTATSGISRPSTGNYKSTALGARYDIFGSERYVLTLDNRAFRELAQYVPYEFVEILVNNATYGGGGIFGQFSTAASGSDWSEYLFVHEFGHHFAALADEYYTSPVAYQSTGERPEPWEPNVTALRDPARLKWQERIVTGTPLPTPWPKAQFEDYERECQEKRTQLRAAKRPESEMNALFRTERDYVGKLFSPAPHAKTIGAFEGANYEASGYYRSEMQCVMFSRTDQYCHVCQNAISEIIDLYSR
jgi:hypothetical protein